MDTARVDQIIQYALLTAGEEDSVLDRELGPIHLLKYVYLADLAYARDHQGATFTGARWIFFDFGPWAPAVHDRIQPAARAIGAEVRSFPSDFGDEAWHRLSKHDARALDGLKKLLPFEIRVDLDRLVHRFGKDTSALLDHVYRTAPMLHAAPNEALDFSIEQPVKVMKTPEAGTSLTARQTKKLREAGRALRERHAAKASAPRFTPRPPPQDEIHAAGMAWLDSLAGEPLSDRTLSAEFDETVWKSSARRSDDLP